MEELKQRLGAVEGKLSNHDTRLVQQEERLRLYAETKYVDGLLKPLETAVTRFQSAFEHITERLDDLATGQQTLNSTYNQLLKERGERENQEHQKKIEILEAQLKSAGERGLLKSVRENINPLLVLIVTFGAVVSLLLFLIKAYVFYAPAK